MKTKEDKIIDELFAAANRYVKFHGGNIVVAGGIQIQEWPGARPGQFVLGIKCFGRRPTADAGGETK